MEDDLIYFNAVFETINLLTKLFDQLLGLNEGMEKFTDFLTEIEAKTEIKIKFLKKSPPTDAQSGFNQKEASPRYWEGVRDMIRLAWEQWMQYQDKFLYKLFLINCEPSIKANLTIKNITDDLDGLGDIKVEALELTSNPDYLDTAIRTIDLISRTFSQLMLLWEVNDFIEFLKHLESNAIKKIKTYRSSQIKDRGVEIKSINHWYAIRDITRVIKDFWVLKQDPQELNQYINKINIYLIRQERVFSELSELEVDHEKDVTVSAEYLFSEPVDSIKDFKKDSKPVQMVETDKDDQNSSPFSEELLKELEEPLNVFTQNIELNDTKVHNYQSNELGNQKDFRAKVLKEALVESGLIELKKQEIKGEQHPPSSFVQVLLSSENNKDAKTLEDKEKLSILQDTLKLLE